jgi:hypothetical protein
VPFGVYGSDARQLDARQLDARQLDRRGDLESDGGGMRALITGTLWVVADE